MNSKVSILRCNAYEPGLVQAAVRRAVDLIGGPSSFIKPKSRVLLKPNILMGKEPQYGITTHPEVVRAVIKILKDLDCQIIVGDGPTVWGKQMDNIEAVYEITGIKKVCEEEGVVLVNFDKRRWRGKFPLTTLVDTCDYIVNVPKLKTHNLTILTGAVKNLFGLISGTYKTELHKNYFNAQDFSNILVDIYELARPVLTIVDGILAMEGDGPATSGKPRSLNLLFASNDGVAMDSVLAVIMGLEPFDILTTKEAFKRGLGEGRIDSISILGLALEEAKGKKFLLPATSLKKKLPEPIINLAKKLIKYYPCAERDNCVSCAVCIQACPNKAITMKNKGIDFDYSKCIACFCCQEMCPNSAIKVRKSLFTKILGL